jgi:hypothetical protein
MRSCFMKAAIVVLLGVTATAWAFPPSNPYLPTGANITGMLDRTLDYGPTQASTGVRTPKPDGTGLQVNMVWSTGVAGTNESFTRYVLSQRFPGDTGDGDGGDLEAFDGVSWMFLSDVPVVVKPYSQIYGTFTFYEGTQNTGAGAGPTAVPANVPTRVDIDWDEVTGGSISAANRGNMFEVGFQVFGPSPPSGQTVPGTLMITTLVPEPGAMALAGLGMAGLMWRRARRT